jgi:hypothetical protein
VHKACKTSALRPTRFQKLTAPKRERGRFQNLAAQALAEKRLRVEKATVCDIFCDKLAKQG